MTAGYSEDSTVDRADSAASHVVCPSTVGREGTFGAVLFPGAYRGGIAITPSNLCDIAFLRDDFEILQKLSRESEQIYFSLSDSRGLAIVRECNGIIALGRGDYHLAMDFYREALSLYRKIGDKRGYVSILEATMKLAVERGEHDRAAQLYGALESLRKKIRYVAASLADDEMRKMCSMLEEKMPPDSFSKLFHEGGALTIEEALKFAESG